MKNNYTDKIVSGSILVFIALFITAISGYFLRFFLSQTLSVEEFGLFYSILVFISFFSIFKDLGLNSAIIKYVPEFIVKNKKQNVKSILTFVIIVELFIATIIFLTIFVFSDQIAITYFHTENASFLLKIFSIIILADTILLISKSFLQGLNQIRYYSIIQPLTVVLCLVNVAILIYLGIVGAVIGYVLGYIIVAILSFFIILKVFPLLKIKTKKIIDKNLGKMMMAFGLPVLMGYFGSIILSSIDTIVLTMFRSLEEVGLYQVALPVSQILWTYGSALSIVLFPIVSEVLALGKKKLLSDILSISLKISFILILPFALIGATFSDSIIRLLFGVVYVPASFALQILCIGSIFFTLWAICNTALVGIGKPLVNTKIMAGAAVFALIASILVVNSFGIEGVALVLDLSFLIAFLASFIYLKKVAGVRFIDLTTITKSVVGGLIMVVIMILIKTTLEVGVILELITSLVVGLSFYMIFILYTKTITKKELEMLVNTGLPIPKFLIKLLSKMAR